MGIYLLLAGEEGAAALLEDVRERLDAENVRPLTDEVTVYEAEKIPYVLNVTVVAEEGVNLNNSAAAAAEEYRVWQDGAIGRPFNPDKLMAMLYQIGASRVTWGEGSNINGGNVEYTATPENACLTGEINLEVVSA